LALCIFHRARCAQHSRKWSPLDPTQTRSESPTPSIFFHSDKFHQHEIAPRSHHQNVGCSHIFQPTGDMNPLLECIGGSVPVIEQHEKERWELARLLGDV